MSFQTPVFLIKSQKQSLENELRQDEKYKHFFSNDKYIVLGVSSQDDFKTIKKKYRKVAFENHPDRNDKQREKYTIISQRINGAYDELKKFHKD